MAYETDMSDPPEDGPSRAKRVLWWPKKCAIATASNMGDKFLIGYVDAWWQWRQRLRDATR